MLAATYTAGAFADDIVIIRRPHRSAQPPAVSWNSEDDYWRDHYRNQANFSQGLNYQTYEPAFRYGVEAYKRYQGKPFAEIEPMLGQGWQGVRGNSTLDWERARPSVQAAYERLQNRPMQEERPATTIIVPAPAATLVVPLNAPAVETPPPAPAPSASSTPPAGASTPPTTVP